MFTCNLSLFFLFCSVSASQTNHFLRDKLQRKLKFDATSSVRATAAHGSQMGSGISSVGTYLFPKASATHDSGC